MVDFQMSLSHLVFVPWWGLLDSMGKMSNFQGFSRVGPRSKISTGEIRKSTVEIKKANGDDM